MQIRIPLLTLLRIGTYPVPILHIYAETDPTFHFNAGPDPNPVPYESGANLRPLVLLKKKKLHREVPLKKHSIRRHKIFQEVIFPSMQPYICGVALGFFRSCSSSTGTLS
jgi:hypothetical protein